jgi:hypothetical protein
MSRLCHDRAVAGQTPSAKGKSKGKTLIAWMDRFAAELLKRGRVAEGLEDQLAVFDRIAKWIAIKRGVEDGDQEGALLNDLRSRVNSERGRPAASPSSGPLFAPPPPRCDRWRSSDFLLCTVLRRRPHVTLAAAMSAVSARF